MSRKPVIANIVAALEGSWHGTGDGEYPTIKPFTFRETTRFATRTDHPAIHYEQRAWRQTPEGEVVSHWETGLLRISSDGSVIINNAQVGRAEALTGTWKPSGDGWIIEVCGDSFAGDARLVSTSRTIHLHHRSMVYDMYMHTTATSSLILHLHAELNRVDTESTQPD